MFSACVFYDQDNFLELKATLMTMFKLENFNICTLKTISNFQRTKPDHFCSLTNGMSLTYLFCL